MEEVIKEISERTGESVSLNIFFYADTKHREVIVKIGKVITR